MTDLIPIRLLLCEPSAIHHEGLTEGFSAALKESGYQATVQVCRKIDQALDMLAANEFEILATDLSFGKHMATGLAFIRKAKSSHPDLCVVACSSGAPTVEEVRANQPSFDLFIPKHVILNPRTGEIDEIGDKIHERLDRLVGIALRIDRPDVEPLTVSGEPISEREIRSLVSQVLADLNHTRHPFRPVDVTFSPVSGGYSGSLVGTLALRGSHAPLKYVKTVIKISFRKWAKDELSNFKKYARWMLPFNKRVELVGEGRTSKFGAVGYAFVFGGEESFYNLTSLIKAQNVDEVQTFIDIIFDDELVNFYNSTRLNSEINAGQHYRERYFPDSRMDETQSAFTRIVQQKFGGSIESTKIKIGNESFTDPFRVIFSGRAKKFSLSICHGDLNSDNIICASPSRVAYIDFQDTGPGHLVQDFAALESSIRLNWNKEETLGRGGAAALLKRELAIARRPGRVGQKAGYDKLCVYVRSLARARFASLEDWEYPYSIGALSLKLMRVRGLNETQLCRLAACALVATRQLEELDQDRARS